MHRVKGATSVSQHAASIKLLEAQKPLLNSQIQAIKTEIEVTERQLELAANYLKNYDKLVAAGHATVPVQLELKRNDTQQKTSLQRARSELYHLQIARNEVDIHLQQLESTRQNQILSEMRESERRLEEVEIALPLARQALEVERNQVGFAPQALGSGTTYIAQITRLDSSGKVEIISLQPSDPLKPGDVVEVRRLIPKTDMAEAAEATGYR